MSKLFNNCIVLILIVITGTFTVNAQTVDTTGVFDSPITNRTIVYSSMVFNDWGAIGNFDASFVLSQSEINIWDDYSTAIAFYSSRLEVRNGNSFSGNNTLNNVNVIPGQLYEFWIDINPITKTYTTWVKTVGLQTPIIIYKDASFRNTNITSINRWSALHNPSGEPDNLAIENVEVVDEIGDIPDQTINYAISLPGGNNGAVSNVAIPALNIPSLPVTIEMWFKPDASQNEYASLIYNRNVVSGIQYDKWTDPTKIKGVWNNESNPPVPNDAPIAGEWNHVALVVSSTNKIVYINGKATSFSGSYSNSSFNGTTYLGWDEVIANRTFKGLIDEVRIWNSAKTAEDIESTKNKTLTGTEAGLIGYWNFDDQANVATDLSGNEHNGILNGATYELSTRFSEMEFLQANTSQPESFIRSNSKDNVVMCLEIDVKNKVAPYHLTQLNLSAKGTSNLSDISNVKVYASSSDSTFSKEMQIGELGASPSAEEFQLSCDHLLESGRNYFWITFDISKSAAEGNTFDLLCNSFDLTRTVTESYVPLNTSPKGKLTINSSLFVNFKKLPTEIVATNAATSIEGANFASFQQNAIMTYKGYQYVTYWNNISRVCLARKKLPVGQWEVIEFKDYTVSPSRVADNHYTISMGICENDGTIHLAFDHHNDELHYRKSVIDLANKPSEFAWTAASFGAKQNYLVSGTAISNVTYPRFISKPNSDLLFECRLGWSGDGDDFLWEYAAKSGTWTYIGEYLNGTSVGENAYINGIQYDSSGRLHVSWVWRQTPDAQTNHDIYYGYSDDDGRSWKNAAAQTIGFANSNPMKMSSPGLKIWTIGTNRGLINQESQAVDNNGGIHILQSYIDAGVANTGFWNSRISNGMLHHIYQDESGTWHNDVLAPSTRNRSEIAVDANNNVYVVAPNYRIYFASAANQWKTWTEFDLSESTSAINEGLIDREALLNENVLSFIFAHSDNNGKIIVPYYLLDKMTEAIGQGLLIKTYDDSEWQSEVDQKQGLVYLTSNDVHVSGNEARIRFEGILETELAEAYTLYLTTSGNTNVWINDEKILETGDLSTTTEFPIALALQPSHNYHIKIEGIYNSNNVVTKLEWSSDSQVREVVPIIALFKNSEQTEILSSDASLSGLSASAGTLNPVFNPAITDYMLVLASGTNTVELYATANDVAASVTGIGTINLTSESTQAEIVVTAADGTVKNYTVTITFQTDNSTLNNEFIKVYPTISSDHFNVDFSGTPGSVSVYNLSGKTISKQQANSANLSIDVPFTGMYILKAESEGQTKWVKVIKKY